MLHPVPATWTGRRHAGHRSHVRVRRGTSHRTPLCDTLARERSSERRTIRAARRSTSGSWSCSASATNSVPAFAMWTAFPPSDYYADSAPPGALSRRRAYSATRVMCMAGAAPGGSLIQLGGSSTNEPLQAALTRVQAVLGLVSDRRGGAAWQAIRGQTETPRPPPRTTCAKPQTATPGACRGTGAPPSAKGRTSGCR